MSQKVRATMCKTCPFRAGSPYANLAGYLAQEAISNRSRVCHSTGESVFYGRTKVKEQICRGTRDIQLQYFAAIKYIDAPTDEAWERKWQEVLDAQV